ncbi:MAG: 3-oxoacyl-ACP reductase FabG [Dehalococcoidia bacterium]|nr:3-oxoacyl-ACP reductase FabG [Dehalococcoidia bacterium]
MGRLDAKVAIVTGSGRGIGRAVAMTFAREGAKVVIAELDLEPAEEVVTDIKSAGGMALAVATDVSNRESVKKMVEAAIKAFGQIDILVNNAGILRLNMLSKMTEDQWDAVLNTHLKGTFNCTQAVVTHMIDRKYGKVINVVSRAGIQGTIGQINYGSAKGGILGFTKSAAKELARYNINVNAVSPGAATRMTEKIRTDPKLSQVYLEQIPLRRWAEPEEIAPAFVFFASDEAAYITGQVLCVDGGLTM